MRLRQNYIPLEDGACGGEVIVGGETKVCEVSCLAVVLLKSRKEAGVNETDLSPREAGDDLPCAESGLDLYYRVKPRKCIIDTPDLESLI